MARLGCRSLPQLWQSSFESNDRGGNPTRFQHFCLGQFWRESFGGRVNETLIALMINQPL